ncbi:MAG TPA: matrixin family metalloprotease [Thermoleophilaceae bacterium]|nr:matrixin family metalloprotease [Thermoleophilaceae bacterium]
MARILTLMLLATALAVPTSSVATPAAQGAEAQAAQAASAPSKARGAKAKRRNPVAVAAAVAKRYWRATPCGGRIKILAKQPLAAGLSSDTDAWVTFGSSLGPNNLAASASTFTDCTISLARWQWSSRREIESDWGMFCLTVIHEMGHLLGREHSQGARGVMAEMFTSEANVPRACNATWLPGWR